MRMGEPGAGSDTTAWGNSEPWLLWMVMAHQVSHRSSRAGATRRAPPPVAKATRRPPAWATTTPTSPLKTRFTGSLPATMTGDPRRQRPARRAWGTASVTAASIRSLQSYTPDGPRRTAASTLMRAAASRAASASPATADSATSMAADTTSLRASAMASPMSSGIQRASSRPSASSPTARSASPARMASARPAIAESSAKRRLRRSSVTRPARGPPPPGAVASPAGPTRSPMTVPASMLVSWKGSPPSPSRASGRTASRSFAINGNDTIDVSSTMTRS